MKKAISIVMVLVLCMGLFTMTGCGNSQPYSEYDLSEYITLANYDVYTTSEPDVNITDEDVETEIEARLEAAATTETVTEGTVEEGDTVNISFEGTLADGTTADGMSSESYALTLGSGGMIDGFESGLYGATIGEEVTLDLQFPDPYSTNEELSGKDVTFKVTVLDKEVTKVPELNEEFVKANSDVETVKEYKAAVKKELEEEEYENQVNDLQSELFTKITEDTEVLQYPEQEVEEQVAALTEQYESAATNYGYDDFETFLSEYYGMTKDEFDEEIKLYAQSIVKQEMILYAMAEKEGSAVTDDEYEEYLQNFMTGYGFESEEKFEEYVGMSLKEYGEESNLMRSVLLEKVLDDVYGRLEKE